MKKLEVLKTLDEYKGHTFAIHFSEIGGRVIKAKNIVCKDNEIIIDDTSYDLDSVTRITPDPVW